MLQYHITTTTTKQTKYKNIRGKTLKHGQVLTVHQLFPEWVVIKTSSILKIPATYYTIIKCNSLVGCLVNRITQKLLGQKWWNLVHAFTIPSYRLRLKTNQQ